MNIPQKCNNPVNLMLDKPTGECKSIYRTHPESKFGYCVFDTPMAGFRAAVRQILSDQKKNLTIKQYIFKFAPPVEVEHSSTGEDKTTVLNDTNEYLEVFCKHLKVTPDSLLVNLSPYVIIGVQAFIEGYFVAE